MTTQQTAPALPSLDRLANRLFIDGALTPSSSSAGFPSINPATGEAVCEIAQASEGDVDAAVRAARAAFRGPWRRTTPRERQNLLLELADALSARADEFAAVDAVDVGLPFRVLRRQVAGAAEELRWFAGQARVARNGSTFETEMTGQAFVTSVKEPVGVVAAITPWNGPLSAAVSAIGPALATGCTVVHKPAPESSLSALLLAELCFESGVPAGVVNVVTGDGRSGAALVGHPEIDKISFTGSVSTGRRIAASAGSDLKRLTLELGGKSPSIVFADADLDAASAGVANAIFQATGQMCIAGSRLFVQRGIYDELVRRVVEHGRSFVVGDPFAEETDLGPLASAGHFQRVRDFIRSGQEEGATLIPAGDVGDDRPGYYVAPTVFTDVSSSMRIYQEEIFGPVLCAIPFDEEEEALELANSTQFGLSAYVWTSDSARALRMASRIEAGTVWVNTGAAADHSVPFGGWKQSGYGSAMGAEGVQEYLQTKAIWIDSAPQSTQEP